ncbi:MAG: ABC transporter permease [Clostridia bacterium]|jgi:ABC-type dipeptide/oligopeptide/nickel transport systems, permease components|nr:ABC transporter permease [Clostridia bacterium]MBQ4452893.1 ABC transporter permease [Clostridia bacterium]
MGNYIFRRVLTFIPILIIMSLVIFFIIQLPPGDYLSSYVAGLKAEGQIVDASELESLKERYGLDQPWFVQYFKWMGGILTRFDFGYSFDFEKPVWPVIAEVLPMTIVVSLATMLFNYLVGIPIGIYSAVHQYSVGDYCFTFVGFLGMAVPNFLFAILLMYATYVWTGTAFIGLYTSEVLVALEQGQMHWYDVLLRGDFWGRMAIPIIVIGTSGTCGTLRSMRAQMLDELGKNYVLCARAKGVSEKRIVYKYCLRAALNPTVSGLSGVLSHIFNGSTISAIVMNLQLVGPRLYSALKAQDMYLAGTILLVMGFLIVLGTLLSDIMLAWLDPRIRFSGRRVE